MVEKKQKIMFVISSMAGGGAERIVSILVNEFDREIFQSQLVLFNKEGEYLDDIPADVEIHNLKKRGRCDFFKLIFKLHMVIKKEKPDCVISFMIYENLIAGIAKAIFRFNCKLVMSERNDPIHELKYARFKWLKILLVRKIYRCADKIITISDGIKDSLISSFGLDGRKIQTIYNPIKIKNVITLSEQNVSHPFFKDCNKPVVISVGRLTRQKNHALLLEAFAELLKHNFASLIILGQGELSHDLLLLSKKLGIEERVSFVGFQKNPYAWIKRADLFVLSSDWEGFGNVIIESMACQTAVISTDCPSGPNEIIDSGENGFLVPVGSVMPLADAMRELLQSQPLRQKMRESAFRKIQFYDHCKIVKEYEKVVENS